MFNWVCPRCGKEVPPSKTECPYCPPPAQEPAGQALPPPEWQQHPPTGLAATAASATGLGSASPSAILATARRTAAVAAATCSTLVATAAPPPQPPQQQAWQQPTQHAQPPSQHPPQGSQHPPAQQQFHQGPGGQAWAPPHQKPGLPTWVMGLGFFVIFLVLGAAIYFGIQRFGRTNVQEKIGPESPATAAAQQKVSNPLQKYVEVVGIRMMSENRKPVARFLVVNHSNAEIAGLEANVTLWASTSRSEEDSVGSFTFKLPNLAANASRN